MPKKVLALVAVLVAVAFFAGCGKKSQTISQEQNKAEVKTAVQESSQGDPNQKIPTGEQGTPPEGGIGRGPMSSEEALAACGGKREGDSCSFTISDEERGDMDMSGACQTPPVREGEEGSSSELVCMPEMKDRPEGAPGTMPQSEN